MADIGTQGDTQFDVKMSLARVEKSKELSQESIESYSSITLDSRFLKNYFANTSTANQTDFILKELSVKVAGQDVKKLVPMIRACNNYIDDSKTLEKTTVLNEGKYLINVNKPIDVRIKTNLFKPFISTMSRFASVVKLHIGKVKGTDDGMVIFDMHCDNEENNIFCIKEDEVEGKIAKLYGDDYICKCYCMTKSHLQ